MAARIDKGRVQLLTRTGLDWTAKYPSAAAALASLNVKTAYLDGELCGVDDAGLPSFARIQAATDAERAARLVFYAFDLIHIDGGDVTGLPLLERKALLEPLVANKRTSPAFSSMATTRARANSFWSTPASSASRAWCPKRSTRLMRRETEASGAKQKRSTAKSSSSSAGPIRKAHGRISAPCSLAITPTAASLSMPAVWALGWLTKFSPTYGAASSR
jgi:hypothetical protein